MEEAGTLRADVEELRRALESERAAAARAASEARQEADAVKQLRYDGIITHRAPARAQEKYYEYQGMCVVPPFFRTARSSLGTEYLIIVWETVCGSEMVSSRSSLNQLRRGAGIN